ECVLDVLARLPAAKVVARYDVEPDRVPTLPAGAVILAAIRERLAVPLRVGRGGVREGAMLELGRRREAAETSVRKPLLVEVTDWRRSGNVLAAGPSHADRPARTFGARCPSSPSLPAAPPRRALGSVPCSRPLRRSPGSSRATSPSVASTSFRRATAS